MQRLTNMHVQRRQQHKHLVGTGHVYQGRYKSFPVETDEYFYQAELKALRRCMHRSQPVRVCDNWVKRVAVTLGLESILRSSGRPKKE